jgi:phage regulator Rha-like protein
MKELIPILNQGNELLIDSRNLAKPLQLTHQHIREQIEANEFYFSRLGLFRFETGKIKPNTKGRPEKYFYLNFEQVSFLISLTRPDEQGKEFHVRLLNLFRAAREKLRPIDNILRSIPEKQRLTFKEEFYTALLRIYGDVYDASKNKPSWVGNWTNKFIYEPIVKNLSNELKAKRKAHCEATGHDPEFIRLHRFLMENAKDELKERIAKTTIILQMSDSKFEFAENYKARFHGITQINFDELLSDDFGGN